MRWLRGKALLTWRALGGALQEGDEVIIKTTHCNRYLNGRVARVMDLTGFPHGGTYGGPGDRCTYIARVHAVRPRTENPFDDSISITAHDIVAWRRSKK